VLTGHDVRIAPSTYYDARGREPSARELSDERWKPIILTTWQKHRKVLGARKLWLRLRRDGHDIARCTVERLMQNLGMAGVVRGKRKRPFDADPR
jgi:putative transposase